MLAGGEAGNWLWSYLPDVLVSVSRGGDKVRRRWRRTDCHCNELEAVRPKKNEKLKIMNGSMRGVTGKLIGVDGSVGIVRVEGNLDVKIVDMVILGKVAA